MYSLSDKELVEILFSGNRHEQQDALFTLEARYRMKLLWYGACKYFDCDIERAERPINRAFMAFYRWANRGKPTPNPIALLKKMVRTECSKAKKREGLERRRITDHFENQQTWLTHEDHINIELEFERKRRIVRVFFIEGNLSPTERLVWELRVIEGLTPEQVSKRRNIKVSNVNVVFSNAVKKFRQYLEKFRLHPGR